MTHLVDRFRFTCPIRITQLIFIPKCRVSSCIRQGAKANHHEYGLDVAHQQPTPASGLQLLDLGIHVHHSMYIVFNKKYRPSVMLMFGLLKKKMICKSFVVVVVVTL